MLVGGCECYSMCDRFSTGGISAGISAPPIAGISAGISAPPIAGISAGISAPPTAGISAGISVPPTAGISAPPLTEPLRLLTFTGMCALVDVCQDENPLLD
jgi:hypothetical protein